MDPMMQMKIYQSGYDDNELWLRDWNPIPGMTYVYGLFIR